VHRFTQLFCELDRTKRTGEKVAAIERYFGDAPPADAAWGLFFLSGRKIKRLIPSASLHTAIQQITGLPDWLISESYEAVGDFAETLALLFPDEAHSGEPLRLPLHEFVEQRMLGLRTIADPNMQIQSVKTTWRELRSDERLVFNKLLTGNFRVGVAQTLIVRALAKTAGVSQAVMAHRFAGQWQPDAESFLRLVHGGEEGDQAQQPYPFYLGYPMDVPLGQLADQLGSPLQWQAEWKYDGIRAQVIRRDEVMIWSRGEELITPAFPEVASAAADLPLNTVLDGEILAWEADHPLPFGLLQRRINRKRVEPTLWTDVPVTFVAFDLLESGGIDIREQPLGQRRTMLESLIAALPAHAAIRTAPLIAFESWEELNDIRLRARELHVEGVMLKNRTGTYGASRKRGDWWKWKLDPYTIDAVLIYAQGGSGRRSGLFTDYTFGVWSDGASGQRELVPVAKAYSGLTDDEIRQVDRFIRNNVIAKHGPVRVVKPELVFELAFQGLQESTRHKAQVALRFPRMNRWRTDKKAEDADTLDTVRALLRISQSGQVARGQ
jgi:DNA ligase-1